MLIVNSNLCYIIICVDNRFYTEISAQSLKWFVIDYVRNNNNTINIVQIYSSVDVDDVQDVERSFEIIFSNGQKMP